jgi:plasminogen activator
MKRISLVLFALALLPVAGWAFQADVIAGPQSDGAPSFAVQPSFGLLNGEAKEHVFDYTTGYRRQLSRLDWQLKNVAMGGLQGSARVFSKLTINAGVWGVLTEGSGKMDDYDWTIDERPDYLTNYSLSEVDVTSGYIFDLNVAWDAWSAKLATARILWGYKQNEWKWEDRGVYTEYLENHFVRDYSYSGMNWINYEQKFQMPYLGTSVDFTPGNFTISGRLVYSPYMWASDKDQHVIRDTYFTEEFQGGDMLGFGLDVRYEFSVGSKTRAFVSAALDYQKIGLIVGDVEMREGSHGAPEKFEDGAGIENEYLVYSLGGGVKF